MRTAMNSRNNRPDSASVMPGGILVMDKPAGITSADVVRRLKRLPGIKKAGHTGTLDPFATGVLVCTVNQGTRLSQFFLHGEKTYAATLRLGVTTDTQDHTGTVLEQKPLGNLSRDAIDKAFSCFTGEIRQLPPFYSALKHNGVPLYRHARNGHFIRKPSRTVHISRLGITNIELPDIHFEVDCTAGTYIRTLCMDIGEKIGCGGHLRALDRTVCGGFARDDAIPAETLEKVRSAQQAENLLVPMAEALRDIPACVADERLQEKIRHGKPLSVEDLPDLNQNGKTAPAVKVISPHNQLLAVIRVAENRLDCKYVCVFHYR